MAVIQDVREPARGSSLFFSPFFLPSLGGESMVLDKYTSGFEVESWHFDAVIFLGRRVWHTGYERDWSGPMETWSPPFPLMTDYPREALAAAAIVGYSFETMYNDDCCETASTHFHVAPASRELYVFLVKMLPIIQPFLAYSAERIHGKWFLDWTDEDRREYWAGIPDTEMPYNKRYWAVTLNPESSHKPTTLEIRMCEANPLKCLAGLQLLIVLRQLGVRGDYRDYYYRYLPADLVENLWRKALDYLPTWSARFVIRALKIGRLPSHTAELVDAGFVGKEMFMRALMDYGLARKRYVARNVETPLGPVTVYAAAGIEPIPEVARFLKELDINVIKLVECLS